MSKEIGVKKNSVNVRIFMMILLGLMSVGAAWARQSVKYESVSFSTPKTLYFTGEKIWIDAEVWLGEEPTTSQVLYAELVSRESNSVAYVKIPLSQGRAFNY